MKAATNNPATAEVTPAETDIAPLAGSNVTVVPEAAGLPVPDATPEAVMLVSTSVGTGASITVTATVPVAEGMTGTLVVLDASVIKVAITTAPSGLTEVMDSGTYVTNGAVVGRRV